MKLDPDSHPRGSAWTRKRPLRLTLLFLTVAALLLLVPAAQAFAESAHVKVTVVGAGSGEIKSIEIPQTTTLGEPPLECSYNGSAQSGACENVPGLLSGEPGVFGEELGAFPAPGSETVSWTLEKGVGGLCPQAKNACAVFGENGERIEWEITVEFGLEP